MTACSLRLAVLGFLCACATEGDVLTRLPPSETAMPRAADNFVDSIGVTIPRVGNPPSFETVVLPALSMLGVRHVRNWAVIADDEPEQVAAHAMLGEMGIDAHLIFEPRFGVTPEHFAPLATALGDVLVSVEGPNDDDANDIDLSAEEVVAYVHGLRDAIDDGGLTGNVQLVDSLDRVEKGDLSAILDYGSIERPRDDALPALDLSEYKRAAREVCGNKPLMVTECGYSSVVVPDLSAAKYLLRLVLGHFDQNIARTFVDELSDGPDDPNLPYQAQGLLHLDGSPKPAFGALQRLIALLDDSGPVFDLTPFDLEIAAASPDLRSLLLQKRNGSYALVMWLEVVSFDSDAHEDLAPQSETVHVALPAPAHVTLYEPLNDSEVILERDAAAELVIEVHDHPAIVMIDLHR